ncbi:peptide transporter family 1-like [Chrysoperla carnea]|uniref:peptide transporter family 1-like n=1 Tax=Chrysoperla carnea TaxID=189513 RepID=UPI001D0900CA|nr:peptide transporter family 1-like [Chrysoperla carnea]
MDDNTATIVYHAFTMCVYFSPIFTGIIADSWFGKFKIIIYLIFINLFGNLAVFGSSFPVFNLNDSKIITLFGLLMISIGFGGTKPCIAAFGGDQFQLPEQEQHLTQYFSLYYFTMNCGSLIAKLVAPNCREDIHCFGEDNCYPAVFGGFTAFVIFSFAFFVLGYAYYIIKKPTENLFVEVTSCIKHACVRKRQSKKKEQRDHWLDYADDQYDIKFIENVKIVLRILVLYIPLTVFAALFDQQGSRWTLQATHMNGEIFNGYFTIKPDQMQVANPIMVFMLIPIYDKIIYPLCAKINVLTDPLKRIFFGGLLASIAFVVSGLLQLAIERNFLMEGNVEVKSVNMLWQLPQYLLMSTAEVMFSVTGLQFSYSQAPSSMKSVLQACWLLRIGFGNLLVIIITGINIMDSQANEFFFFAILLTTTMFIFLYLAHNYKKDQTTKCSTNDEITEKRNCDIKV